MITARAKKTSLENENLCNYDYFAIIPSCSHFNVSEEPYNWIGSCAVKLNAQN